MGASLGSFRFFGIAPSCEARFLTPVVWACFQFIVLTGVTVEEDDFFLGFADLRHGVVTSGKAIAARAFWTGDAEAPASSVASASSYSASKDVRVLAVVKAELKFGEIQRQILLADVMVRPDHAPFQQGPEVIDIRGMDFAAHVFARAVANELVRIIGSQIHVTVRFIGRDQINPVANGLAHEAVQRAFVGALDHLADDITFAADCADDRSLARRATADLRALAGVFVLFFSAHEGLVYLDDAHELLKFGIVHRGPQPMTHKPCGAVGTGTDHPMDLQGTDTLLAGQHQVENLEPDQERVIRILENRARDEREAICVGATLVAFPSPRALSLIYLLVIAARATDSVRPAMLHQVALAGIFVWKEPIKLREGHLSDKLWFACFNFLVHETRIAK